MNYSDAQSNCRNKYGDNTGRLFEPHSQTPQRTLHEEAIKHDSEPIWIGISPGMKNSPGHVKSNSFLSYFGYNYILFLIELYPFFDRILS